jgi:hypothetical protein
MVSGPKRPERGCRLVVVLRSSAPRAWDFWYKRDRQRRPGLTNGPLISLWTGEEPFGDVLPYPRTGAAIPGEPPPTRAPRPTGTPLWWAGVGEG